VTPELLDYFIMIDKSLTFIFLSMMTSWCHHTGVCDVIYPTTSVTSRTPELYRLIGLRDLAFNLPICVDGIEMTVLNDYSRSFSIWHFDGARAGVQACEANCM